MRVVLRDVAAGDRVVAGQVESDSAAITLTTSENAVFCGLDVGKSEHCSKGRRTSQHRTSHTEDATTRRCSTQAARTRRFVTSLEPERPLGTREPARMAMC